MPYLFPWDIAADRALRDAQKVIHSDRGIYQLLLGHSFHLAFSLGKEGFLRQACSCQPMWVSFFLCDRIISPTKSTGLFAGKPAGL